jgi:hypothetical protein
MILHCHHVCHNKVNNFTTNGPFYSAVSELKRSTSLDTFQVFDIQNPSEIDEDITIPDDSSGTTVSHHYHACYNNHKNSATTCPFQSARPALKSSVYEDAIWLSHCPSPSNIDEDMTIIVSTIIKQYQKILFTSSQYTWRTLKSVTIGKTTSETYSQDHENDFRISLVKMDPTVLEIRLVVPLSSA